MSRLQGASGIHVGTMGIGKMEGDAGDRINAYLHQITGHRKPVLRRHSFSFVRHWALLAQRLNRSRPTPSPPRMARPPIVCRLRG